MVPSAPPRPADERRTVTTLFCDLVGFTAMSEAADPEDVDACLRAYGARARALIERHGGTVEKFIGDAVVGVFGIPLAHEDDAERAVRAALRLVRATAETLAPDGSSLRARAGVNTGDVLVRGAVSGRPAEQGLVTGDPVNVAARLQAAAPPGGVVVGGITHDLTRRVVRYEPLAPVIAKGKAEPVEAWLAVAPVARTGAGDDGHGRPEPPFIGREIELAALEHEFDEALRLAATRVALVVGDAGMGKSALVAELSRRVDRRAELVTWREGRCLPYGESAAFGAFAEVVKAHAGILDTDDAETRRGKLDAALPAVGDRAWMLERLGALAGVPAPESTVEENVAAWTRFVAALAGARPVVLVLEDVHRADDRFLDFVEALASAPAGLGAVLLALTARPELLERRPGFPASAVVADAVRPCSVLRVELPPLTDAEVRLLVAGLGAGRDGALADRVARAAAGNPLHVAEAARLLAADGPVAALPASIAAVYAARLDGLPPAQREALTDAAVVGSTFWDGALAAVGRRPRAEAAQALEALAAAMLVRPEGESTVAGEREFAFVHTIAREVAYGRLTRSARAHRHAAVADWLEAKAESTVGAFVDEIAHHRASACRLALAAGEAGLADEVRGPAVRSIREAGRRAASIDASEAERWYSLAVELVDASDPLRPFLHAEWGKVVFERGRVEDAVEAVSLAIDGFKRAGHTRAAAAWSSELAGYLVNKDDAGWRAAQDEAERLIAADEECEEALRVLYGKAAWLWMIDNDPREALAVARRRLVVTRALGLDESGHVELEAMIMWRLGDRTALETLRRLEGELPTNDGGIDYCHASLAFEGPQAAIRTAQHHIAFFERAAQTFSAESFRAMLAGFQLWAGEWAAAAAMAKLAASRLADAGLSADADFARFIDLQRQVWCGDRPADELVAVAVALAYRSALPSTRFQCSLAWASAALAAGRTDDATPAIRAATTDAGCDPEFSFLLFPEAVRVALRLQEVDGARVLAQGPAMDVPVAAHVRIASAALLAEADGRLDEAAAGFADAADRWRAFGVPYEEGQALLGQGRCLVAAGRPADAATPLTAACAIFARLGAEPALLEAEDLVSRTAVSRGPAPRD